MEIHPKITPIYQTSVFKFEDLNELELYFGEPGSRYLYSRNGNPNSDELAEAVNRLEGGAGAIATGSGMAAIFAALLACCHAGDHVLCAADIYGGSLSLLNNELSRMGISVTYVPFEQLYDLQQFVQPTTRLLLAETMSNPLLRVADLRRLAAECHQVGLKLVVDNTFATPVITQPLALGADIVLHSVTKYIAGHSDVTAGAVVASDTETATRLKQIGILYGLTLSPMESWLAVRGLKTLRLRMREHSHNALAVAEFLQQQPGVRAVYYPGLPNHPQHALAREQGKGLFGGMMSVLLNDDAGVVNRFMQRSQRFPFAPSLAGVDSSLSYPLGTSHRYLTPEQQADLGITVGLVRLSVGIEPLEELLADLQQALHAG
ncbi:aminotransferase class I/II-fold pyridoxal phosphate-dependent enzyme [Microvirga sp. STR05]|uniref:Aminotransferase class I/II-fold pyridoxal phosphate-dependent enzyme n=1 Tax=Hymenobacter duratus TaxID=2771356 RepID=A0ABR8JJK0_9BACT|nr:aminotransferase class I/II-fold pyridoxal phosphate-dependent enzyme [Hymenobacter duratus]MBD2715801.1 aminotransferase class I/II-fold pyridoxal phosphate-dependent enzyme [Hymenobacter duratus]MBR7950712.1 aminotransferase class I/II-fold pyridoxal phosphate-dependent enzyme [Microvirga sp. STR05]